MTEHSISVRPSVDSGRHCDTKLRILPFPGYDTGISMKHDAVLEQPSLLDTSSSDNNDGVVPLTYEFSGR